MQQSFPYMKILPDFILCHVNCTAGYSKKNKGQCRGMACKFLFKPGIRTDTAQVWFHGTRPSNRRALGLGLFGLSETKTAKALLPSSSARTLGVSDSFPRKLSPIPGHPSSPRRRYRLRRRNAGLQHPRRRCRLPLRCLRLPGHLHGPRHRVPATGNQSPRRQILQIHLLNPTQISVRF